MTLDDVTDFRGRYLFATEDGTVICAWVLMCDRDADVLVSHPTLGRVPACQRCADEARR